mmetsp:Transcript_24139/g.32910  ORF Transcript_24139/g.32910 Transcript_24139/m.32910 type:complete len:186 (+) Transcript_24139:1013-1570(+)
MAFLSIFVGYFCVGQFKSYGERKGHSDNYLTALGSAAAFFNSIRFVWSAILDKVSYKYVYGTMLVIQIIVSGTMPLFATNNVIYATWVCLALFCEGGHFTILPNELLIIFGDQASSLYGIAFLFSGTAAILLVILQETLLDSIGFDAFFYTFALLSFIALMILIFVFEDKPVNIDELMANRYGKP